MEPIKRMFLLTWERWQNVYSVGVEIIVHLIDTNISSNSMQISIGRKQFTLYLFAVEGWEREEGKTK